MRMSQKRTIPVEKICPICGEPFPVCPPGKKSRFYPPYDTVFNTRECAAKGRYRHGSACKTLAPGEASYLAGFMDGEGSIILHRRADTDNVSLRVQISNTNRIILDHIKDITGLGNIIESPRRDAQRHKLAYLWCINSDAASSLLEQVSPYMRVKKIQVELAVRFWSGMRDPATKVNRQWQDECLNQMRALNQRGPK